MDRVQQKYKFDQVTREKILKSFFLSLLSGAGAFCASIQTGSDIKKAGIVAASTMVSFIVNSVIQYISGEDVKGDINHGAQ